MKKIALWLALAAALITPSAAYAQVCPAVAALPDSERRVAYAPSASTGPFSVTFAVLGDGTDYGAWVEVWLNGVMLTPVTQWQLTIPAGTLATACRPITNASITLTTAATGTLQIVGARRPRRTSQFPENAGVSARNLNQVITDLTAQSRETWDKINDVTGRAVIGLPGETITPLAPAATRASKFFVWDALGNPSLTSPTPGLGNVIGPVSSAIGSVPTWADTTGTALTSTSDRYILQSIGVGTQQPLIDFIDVNQPTGGGIALRFFAKDSLGTGRLGAVLNCGFSDNTAAALKGDCDWIVYTNGPTVAVCAALSATLSGFVPCTPNVYNLGASTQRWSTVFATTMDVTSLVLGSPLGVASGGTGRPTLTDRSILVGRGTAAVDPAGPCGTREVLQWASLVTNPVCNSTPTLTAVAVGAAGVGNGFVQFFGITSGSVTLRGPAVGGSGILTLPDATDTIVGKATTDILTNKTFNTAGAGNVFQINSVGITAVTGTGSVALSDSPTFTTQLTSTCATSACAPITATSTNTDAVAGPIMLVFRNSASPAVNDSIGLFQFAGKSDTAVTREYANLGAMIVSPTNGAETGQVVIATTVGGAAANRVAIQSGLSVGGGADPGVGSLRLTGSLNRAIPVTETTTTHTVAATTTYLITNNAGTVTVTLPAAASFTGRELYIKTITAATVISASSNVVPSTSPTAGTAILPATDGAWARLVSDGTNWVIMAANPLI